MFLTCFFFLSIGSTCFYQSLSHIHTKWSNSSIPKLRNNIKKINNALIHKYCFYRDPESCDVPLPPKPTHSRERSLTKPPSPRLLRHSMGTPTEGNTPLRNSWPDATGDEAPPLPPRSHSKCLHLQRTTGKCDTQ